MKTLSKLIVFIALSQVLYSQVNWTIDDFLDEIEKSNHDLQLAEQEKVMAKAYKNEARSTALPKLVLEANFTRNLDKMYMYVPGFIFGDTTGATFGMPINYKNDYSFSAVLNQSLFDANAFYARRATRELERVTDNVYRVSRQTVYAYAQKAFYQTLLAGKFTEVSASSEMSARENYEDLKQKFEQGIISELALLQAEVRWRNAIPEVNKAQRNYRLALNFLKKMAGYDLSADLEITGSFEDYPELPPEVRLSNVLEERSDYQALKWEGELRSTNVKSKFAAYLPQVSANAIYAFSGASDEFKVENDNSVYMLGLNLSWPLWLGGYQEAQVQKAKVDVRKNQIKQEQMAADIAIDIENVKLRLAEARERIAAAEALLATAEKAFNIAETTSRNGLITQLELKDARVGYDQARLNHYAAVFDYLDAHFDWQLATGQIKTGKN